MLVMGGRGSINPVLAQGRGASGNGLLTGLIAYWKLDEASGNAIDAHSNGLTLTANNAPGADTGKVYSTARTFNGSSQYFSRTNETALQTGDIDFALAAWVYMTSKPTVNTRAVSKRVAFDANDYELVYSSTLDKFQFLFGSSAQEISVTHTTTPSLNTWHLITAWHDATSNLMWINTDNETPVSRATGTVVPAASNAPLEIGRLYQLAARWWVGRLGPVAFWKNRTLDAAARSALWNGGNGLAYSSFTA